MTRLRDEEPVGLATGITSPPLCPLCRSADAACYHASAERQQYFRCPRCTLVFLDPSQRLSRQDERARYELHRNEHGDPEYVRFLRRLADPVIERLPPGASGLDFGCGPAPVLSAILADAGFPCASYDPFFAPADALLARRYEFVTCSEVVEHTHDPAATFAQLGRLLVPGGLLGVMTRFYGLEAPFATWWYRRDPTHVCFYAESTMRWIAERHGWTLTIARPHVAVFTTAPAPGEAE